MKMSSCKRVFSSLLCFFVVYSGIATMEIKSQDVQGPRVIKAVLPDYPFVAASLRKSGIVVVEATVNTFGIVTDVNVIEGEKILSNAASIASSRWLFSKDTEKTIRHVRIQFRFKLLENVKSTSDLWTEFLDPYDVEIRSRPIVVKDSPNIDPKVKRKRGAK